MSAPYFPMYPADFEADTSHLTLEEDGAYNRLLRLMWMTPGCSLPDDEKWIMRRMRCDEETFERVVAPLISEFMKRSSGRIFSSRLTKEFKKADITSKRRAEAGKKGGRPQVIEKVGIEEKPGFVFDKPGLLYARALPEPEPEPKRKIEPSGSPKKLGTRLPDGWEPDVAFALKEGLSALECTKEAEKFRDHWRGQSGQRGVKADWAATWRNWVRNAVERLKPPPRQVVSDWRKLPEYRNVL